MSWAPESATAVDEPEEGSPTIDVRRLLRALPDPELPDGLEDRVRARLGGRAFPGH